VATLLALARDGSQESLADGGDESWVEIGEDQDEDDSDDLDHLKLWIEIKKQVAILRQGMDEEKGGSA
jgi:transitional endoplasmic reticulum ATPase